MIEHFIYVDASWRVQTSEKTKFMPWRRIQLTQVHEQIVVPSNNHNCFTSIQRYRDAVSDRKDEFKTDRETELPSEAQIGRKYQDHYCGLFFDFDASASNMELLEDVIEKSLSDVRKVASFFLEKFDDINPAHVQVWFSGSKGFHLLVRPEVFEITPHSHLTYMIKNMAWALTDLLDLTTLDQTVYTVSRLWRIENSTHQKTNLHKIELDVMGLGRMNTKEIIEMAKTPRTESVWEDVEYENIVPVKDAVAWWKDWEQYFEWQESMAHLYPRERMKRPDGEEGIPACMHDLTDNGPKDGGRQRNHVSMVMATFWKDMGFSLQSCMTEIDRWTTSHFGTRPSNELRTNIANGRSAARSVYKDDKYAFTCSAIKACGDRRGRDPVACDGDKCTWVPNKEAQEPDSIPELHLSEASKGIYHGKKVSIQIHVSGKCQAPYGLPIKGIVRCPSDPDKRCAQCPCGQSAENEIDWHVDASSRAVLNMVDVTDAGRRRSVRINAGFPPDCQRARVKFGETSNVEVVQMIPMVDHSTSFDTEGTEVAKSQKHAVRDGYFIGHDIEANKKFTITAYTYQHPADQRVVHLFEEAEPVHNDIQHFKLSEAMKKRLEIFQPKKGQSIADKMRSIHHDFTYNVHNIRKLQTMSECVDLAFHSVIGFHYLGKPMEKGYFELLVLGDSGTGKSTLTKALIRHFRLGELTSGEGMKRTGLVWASVQINNRWTLKWGKMPQNDRRLLVIDEFGEMAQEEVEMLTMVRSEGIARGQGVSADYSTWARTRLILLSNVKGSGDLSQYSHGIKGIADLFSVEQDLRRTDLAVTVRKNEVGDAANYRFRPGEVPHTYTSDLCHNLILWAWSREPGHIEFVNNSDELILEMAIEIGNRYESDIYLVIRNDMRHKLARVSVAVAVRMFSTDSRCQKVIVDTHHVKYASELFNRCYGYKNPFSSMRYHQYAMAYQHMNNISAERKVALEKRLMEFGDHRDKILRVIDQIDRFRKMDMEDQLAMPQAEFLLFWRFLTRNNFIRRESSGMFYKKTGAFNTYMNMLINDIDIGELPENQPNF